MNTPSEMYNYLNQHTLDRLSEKMKLVSRLAMAILREEPDRSMARPEIIKAIVAQGFTAADARNCLTNLEQRAYLSQSVASDNSGPSVVITLTHDEGGTV